MHDLLFRNALLLDGTGAPGKMGDLGVSQGRISLLGKGDTSAKKTIDADGLALMPGIVDTHTHYDAQVTWDPCVTPSPALGVTTAVIGNCGFTIAPCKPADRDLVMKNLTQVEGMSLEALRAGTRWDFESVPEYFAMLERRGVAVNVAGFVGHSSVRTYVMGEDAPKRAATDSEIQQMKKIVLEGVRAGAVGFATSTSANHNGHGGIPMPSRMASDDEMRALVGCLKDAGHGVFMLTKGSHTRVDFLEELAADSGRTVIVAALFFNNTNPTASFKDLDAIGAAVARGRRMIGAISCCPLTSDFPMHTPYPLEGILAWAPALGLAGEAMKAKLADQGFRDAIRDELSKPAVFRIFNGEWDKVSVAHAALERNRRWEGVTLAEVARETRADPLDAMLDLAIEEDLQTEFSAVLLNSDDQGVARLLRHPHSMVSLSDAGAHLTLFNDAGFGLHLLSHWVRDQRVLSLEQAVWRLTGHPAGVFGLKERGLLKQGYAADLMLFDPKTIARRPKERLFDLPGGQPRFITRASGVHGVWVNGECVADANGMREITRLPGKVLREFSA